MATVTRIFISSTSRDLKAFRELVEETLKSPGTHVAQSYGGHSSCRSLLRKLNKPGVLELLRDALANERMSLQEAIKQELNNRNANKFQPRQQAHLGPSYRSLVDALKEEISSSDFVICLVGFLFGSAPRARLCAWYTRAGINLRWRFRTYLALLRPLRRCLAKRFPSLLGSHRGMRRGRRSYTQLEFDMARKLHKPIYVYLAQPFNLRLVASPDQWSGIPDFGKNLVVVADVHDALKFRVFDSDGRLVVDTEEAKLTKHARQIVALKEHLKDAWPPHNLTEGETDQIITAVTSIVGYTIDQHQEEAEWKKRLQLDYRRTLESLKKYEGFTSKEELRKKVSSLRIPGPRPPRLKIASAVTLLALATSVLGGIRDRDGPKVTSISPPADSQAIDPRSNVRVEFDEPLRIAAVTLTLEWQEEGATKSMKLRSPTFDETRRAVTWVLPRLKDRKDYRATVSGAQDFWLNPMKKKSWTITTWRRCMDCNLERTAKEWKDDVRKAAQEHRNDRVQFTGYLRGDPPRANEEEGFDLEIKPMSKKDSKKVDFFAKFRFAGSALTEAARDRLRRLQARPEEPLTIDGTVSAVTSFDVVLEDPEFVD
jgi:hypothetical protein